MPAQRDAVDERARRAQLELRLQACRWVALRVADPPLEAIRLPAVDGLQLDDAVTRYEAVLAGHGLLDAARRMTQYLEQARGRRAR